MFSQSNRLTSRLPNIAGADLPPLDLGVPLQFQYCVDAGAAAAVGFFSGLADFNLHDHIAHAVHSFSISVSAGLAAVNDYDQVKLQRCIDAFAAGYLGRVQQELRLFHCEIKHTADSSKSNSQAYLHELGVIAS